MLYDLNLRADIPKDRFFIVMPSPAARGSLSVGRAFFMKQGHTEQLEQILLIIPRPLRDAAYRIVAAVRHRIAGRSNACEIPPPEIRDLMI